MINNKTRKLMVLAFAVVVLASGCSAQNNASSNDSTNNNQAVVEQTEAPAGNDSNEANDQDGTTDQNAGEQTNDSEAADSEVTAAKIIDKITTDVEVGSLITLQDEQVKDMYGINVQEALEEGIFKPAMMNVHAYEVAVVKLKSDEYYEQVADGMEQRAAAIQKTFETYLQDQYEASKNYQIIRKGDYVLFSITPDQEKTAEIFDQMISE